MPNLSAISDYENLPLFQAVAAKTCDRCFNTGLRLSPSNVVETCPILEHTRSHALPNRESIALRRSVDLLAARKIWINSQAFDLTRLLTNFNSQQPCLRQEIFRTFYDSSVMSYANQLRKFHALIEELRGVWRLPVGSRKEEPSGYWIITDLDDYKTWYRRATAAPITQLTTIHRNARHNFPVFAEQMELDFWNDLKKENEVGDVV